MDPITSELNSINIFSKKTLLPSEAIIHIFSFLDLKSVAVSESVNKDWQIICRDPMLWKLFANRLGLYESKDGNWRNAVKFYPEIKFQKLVFSKPYTKEQINKMMDGSAIQCIADLIKIYYPNQIHEPKAPLTEPFYLDEKDFNKNAFILGSCNNKPAIACIVKESQSQNKCLLVFYQCTSQIPSLTVDSIILKETCLRDYSVIEANLSTINNLEITSNEFNWKNLNSLVKTREAEFTFVTTTKKVSLYFPEENNE